MHRELILSLFDDSNAVVELARGVKFQLEGLIRYLLLFSAKPYILIVIISAWTAFMLRSGLSGNNLELGLSHNMSRYKLKFSPDKASNSFFMLHHISLPA